MTARQPSKRRRTESSLTHDSPQLIVTEGSKADLVKSELESDLHQVSTEVELGNEEAQKFLRTNILDLSQEILAMIFIKLDYKGCKGWALSCKRLAGVARDPYNQAQYFLLNFGRREALYHAIWQAKVITPKCIDILIKCGAIFSRYLFQTLTQTYFRGNVAYVRPGWGKSQTVPHTILSHLFSLASQRWPEDGSLNLEKNSDDGSLFSRWYEDRKRAHQSQLQNQNGAVVRQNPRYQDDHMMKEWEKIKELFQTYNFIPFSCKDSLLIELPKAVAFEPELLHLAQKNGFALDTRLQDFVMRSAFSKVSTTGAPAHLVILETVRNYLELNIGFYISVNVASEILREAEETPSAYEALKLLKKEELLFNLAHVARDVILSLDNKQLLMDYPLLTRMLYKDYGRQMQSERVDAIVLATFFGPPIDNDINGSNNLFRTPKSIFEQTKKLGMVVTPDIIVDVICNPLTFGVDKIISFCGHYFNFDTYDIIERAARKMVRIPFKGHTLMVLVNKYPHLKKVIEEEILKHEIDIDKLTEATHCVKCRFTCRHSEKFYSPIATQRVMYKDGLQYMTEVSYVSGRSFENYDISQDLSKPVWKSKDGAREVGNISFKRRGEAIDEYEHPDRRRNYNQNSLRYNYNRSMILGLKREIVQEGVPTAIALLDWFPANSKVLQIVLIHAGINVNHDVVHTYLTEGVPLTVKWFEYMAKIGYILPSVFEWTLNGMPCYKDETEVPSASFSGCKDHNPKRSRSCKHDKHLASPKEAVQASTSAALPWDMSALKVVRPRRSVSCKNYVGTAVIDDDFDDEDEEESPDDDRDVDFEDVWEKKKTKSKSRKDKYREMMHPEVSKWLDVFVDLAKKETTKVLEKKMEKRKDGSSAPQRVRKTEFHKELLKRINEIRQDNKYSSSPTLLPKKYHPSMQQMKDVGTDWDDFQDEIWKYIRGH